MQRNQLVKKVISKIDGEELEGLVSFTGFKDEKGTASSPSFRRGYDIPNGVKKQTPPTAVYAPKRGGKTAKFLNDWWEKDESHDVEEITTDSQGAELQTRLFRDFELQSLTENDYDAENPEEWRITIVFAPTAPPVKVPQ